MKKKRFYNRNAKQSLLIFDGHCQFCRGSVRLIEIMDVFAVLKYVDYHGCERIEELHPQLTKEKAHSQLYLIEPDGALYGGFFVFRRLCFSLPMLYPWIPVFYFPGSGVLGPMAYQWVAKNRYLFHFNRKCKDNACFR